MDVSETLEQALNLAEDEPDEALRLVNVVLNDDPEHEQALFMAGYILMQASKFGLAYNLFKRCAEMRPDQPEIWNNLGMCLEYSRFEEAAGYMAKAAELKPDYANAYANQGIVQLRMGRPERCERLCRMALSLDPECSGAKQNLALALLMQRKWKEGWKVYRHGRGSVERKIIDYGVPDWDGKSPGTVVIYGEQGIGDEIMFASCIPDAQERADVVIDCSPRLRGLFERSFGCPTYGTRFQDSVPWLPDHKIDYQCMMGDLPAFYRNKHKDFPRTPYLEPDPDRCVQWRALFDTLPGRKIGLAWTGGIKKTMRDRRAFGPETFAPLLDSGDTYISLEYKEHDPIEGIRQWPRATIKGCDIDETVALISELDLVISVCTSVIYMAGGLGVECWVLVPEIPGYRYHSNGDLPWFQSVRSMRQEGEWSELIQRVRRKLDSDIHRLRPPGNGGISRPVALDTYALQRAGVDCAAEPEESEGAVLASSVGGR